MLRKKGMRWAQVAWAEAAASSVSRVRKVSCSSLVNWALRGSPASARPLNQSCQFPGFET